MVRLRSLLFILFIAAAAESGEASPKPPQTVRQAVITTGQQSGVWQNDSGQNDGQNGEQSGGGQNDGGQNGGGQNAGGRKDGSEDREGKHASDLGDSGPNDGAKDSRYGNDVVLPIDLDGARANFAAIVEAYVASKSDEGYWPYAEKKGGKAVKPWHLEHPLVIEKSIRRQKGTRFSGLVKLRDARGGRLALEFVIDFSGVDWKVVAVKPAPARRQ